MYSRDIEDQSEDAFDDNQNRINNRIPYQIYHRSNSSMQSLSSIEQQDDLYVFVKFLGRGSFGSVNLYRYTKENILVAWKEIDLNGVEDRLQSEIISEIEILASLDHPNIISYYKHFIGESCLYIELEYANGGTLMHLIKQQRMSEHYFPEEVVLWYLYQIMSAVEYLHNNQILHRDIKSLNIFATKAGLLKLGDFGLAKRLDPEDPYANTQVGTPHYMAPEILNGHSYGYSTDIWSVGCVLYEMLTLNKVFDATNQLKLAMRILQSDVNLNEAELKMYSEDMKALVKVLLEKNPSQRPTAKEILANKLFANKILEYEAKIDGLNYSTRKTRGSASTIAHSNSMYESLSSLNETESPIIASKLSESYIWGGGKQLPQKLENFKRENAPLQVCVGLSHYALITVQKELYTWSASQGGSQSTNYAKLGLGKSSGPSRIPRQVESLNGIFIRQVACGEDFTCCISDDGTLYTFGADYCGRLGIGQENYETISEDEEISDRKGNIFKPIPVPFFYNQSIKVAKIACGDSHIVCLTENNEVYTWGNGEYGRLGHGDENDVDVPRKLNFRLKYVFQNVFAGPDCSFLVTNKGKVLAFGNNESNKLGLNNVAVGVKKKDNKEEIKMTSDIPFQLTPKWVKNLINYKIHKIASGSAHTAAIDSSGRLFTFGANKFGQLGVGDCKVRHGINIVGGVLTEHHVINVSCGDLFTICATSENHVFSFGNCKDGRLGLELAFNRDDANIICTPRPIFGSLYQVSDMCSRYWNSIIIAEKVIDAKTVRSISQYNRGSTLSSGTSAAGALQTDSVDSDYGSCNAFERNNNNEASSFLHMNDFVEETPKAAKLPVFENIPQCSRILDSIHSDNMPEWLKNDLYDAEFIPIDALRANESFCIVNDKKEASQGSSTRTLENSDMNLEEALELIKKLKIENSELKDENTKLKIEINELKNAK